MKVRRALDSDWLQIRELCCRTGNAGAPIDPSRWPFFSEQWIGPYEKLERNWAYVVCDDSGLFLGYLTGCKNTNRFERQRSWVHGLPLFLRTVFGSLVGKGFVRNGDVKRFQRRFLGFEQGPEQAFSNSILFELKKKYPAHLHMNIEDFARGTGSGRMLIEQYRRDLSADGVPGIHLFCGDGPLPFYSKLGFEVLHKIEFRKGLFVYALGGRV